MKVNQELRANYCACCYNYNKCVLMQMFWNFPSFPVSVIRTNKLVCLKKNDNKGSISRTSCVLHNIKKNF